MDEKALGRSLQAARRRAGLTQQELCQKAGLSYSTLAKIERGAIKSPSVFTVASIAAATGSTIETLLDIQPTHSAEGKKTSKTGVRFVYFDLNNTLVRGYEKAFAQIAEQCGQSVDIVEMAFWRNNAAANSGQMSMAEFNQALADKLNLPGFEWQKYYLDLVEPVPGMDELVHWAAKYYEVGILSGTMPGLIKALRDSSKLPDVNYLQIIDSSEVHLLKDSAAIFELAQKRTAYAPKELLLVDDDRLSLMLADEQGWQISRFDAYSPEEGIARIKQHLEF